MKYFTKFPLATRLYIVLAHDLQRKVSATEAFVSTKARD